MNLRARAKLALVPVIYRYPPVGLEPERLAIYLDGLLSRHHLQGDVAEVGCSAGGTAIVASTLLRNVGFEGSYTCFDTFGGFVAEQFDADAALGTTQDLKTGFSASSKRLVRKILDYHRCEDVEVVEGDIVRVPEGQLSDNYVAALLDVDLSEPTYAALTKFWPRIVPGGVLYVDDCAEGDVYKARLALSRFCGEQGLAPTYRYGFGILEKATV